MLSLLTPEDRIYYNKLLNVHLEKFDDELTSSQEREYFDPRHVPQLRYFLALARYIREQGAYVNTFKLIVAYIYRF